MEPMILRFQQSSLRIEAAGLRVYIDPYHLPPGQPPADVLLISHEHRDHLSPDDIALVRHAGTRVYASSGAAGLLGAGVHAMRPGDSAQDGPLKIQAVPAYTVTKFRSPGVVTHPRESQHLGFRLEMADLSFYFAGDTDVIPEMESIGPVDYAFLPVGGSYVMTAEEAAEAARLVQPSIAIPIHYGMAAGTVEDAERFAQLVPDQVRVWILPPTTE